MKTIVIVKALTTKLKLSTIPANCECFVVVRVFRMPSDSHTFLKKLLLKVSSLSVCNSNGTQKLSYPIFHKYVRARFCVLVGYWIYSSPFDKIVDNHELISVAFGARWKQLGYIHGLSPCNQVKSTLHFLDRFGSTVSTAYSIVVFLNDFIYFGLWNDDKLF